MPKKSKKGKEGDAGTAYVFDYRYTPKPYFTAPLSSPATARSISVPGNLKTSNVWGSPRSSPSSSKKPNGSYSKAVKNEASSSGNPSRSMSSSFIEEKQEHLLPDANKKTVLCMFVEMFKGRIEQSVVEMVLQDVNWNGLWSLCFLLPHNKIIII